MSDVLTFILILVFLSPSNCSPVREITSEDVWNIFMSVNILSMALLFVAIALGCCCLYEYYRTIRYHINIIRADIPFWWSEFTATILKCCYCGHEYVETSADILRQDSFDGPRPPRFWKNYDRQVY